jgi:hypothetical protein
LRIGGKEKKFERFGMEIMDFGYFFIGNLVDA